MKERKKKKEGTNKKEEIKYGGGWGRGEGKKMVMEVRGMSACRL